MKKDARGELHVIFESVAPSSSGPSIPLGAAAAAPSSSSLFGRGASAMASSVSAAVGSSSDPNLLYVTLVSGKDLLAMDGGKTSDPLVKLTMNGQRHESSTKEKTLRPQWNERFGFFATNLNTTLSLVVEDYDTTINDFMGSASIELSKIQPNVEKTMTLELLDKKGRKDKLERGTITVSLLWTFDPEAQQIAAKKKDTSVFGRIKQTLKVGGPDADYDSNEDDGVDIDFSEKDNKSEEERKAEEEEREKKRQETLAELSAFEIKSGDYVVQVHIIEARDLVPKDSTGTSDPVVYVEVLGEVQKTAVKKQVLNCVWDDLLIFSPRGLDKAEVEMGFVKLSVMDANTLQRAELIGTARFDISYIYSQKNHQLANVWIGLIDDTNTVNQGIQGYLRASVTVVGPGDKLVAPPSPFGPGAASDDMEGNVLMPPTVTQNVRFVALTIHKAEELPPMDFTVVGKSGLDAYVKANLAGGDSIRTRVRSKKGARHELSPSFNEELLLVMREPSMADKISIGVYDWDRVGSDEVVGHIFQSIKMLKAMGGRIGPLWANIYGAPVNNKVDVGNSSKKQMNKLPDLATTYRGRVLMTLRILDNDNNEFDESNQKRNVKKLPLDLYPKMRIYKMRAHFVWGSEIPTFTSAKHLGQNSKMQLVMSLGLNEISSERAKNIKGLVEWNNMEESERMLLPEDVSQIPDIFLYLCKGDGDSRRAVCYKRFTAKELIEGGGFERDLEWVSLKEDPAQDALSDDEFPGNVLVRLGFGTEEEAEKVRMNHADRELVNKRTPYQVRVHVYQGRRLPPADSNGLLDPYLVVRCMAEKPKETSRKKKTRDPVYYETLYFDVNLPDLKYAPQVLLRVMDHDDFDSNDYVGLVALNMSEAHVRTSAQLSSGKLSQLPNPRWYPLMFQEPGDSEGEILASIELIRKQFPDEEVPLSTTIVPKTRKAYLELTVLGLRSMEPFQFLPIQLPFVEFILGGKDHASQEMITERSKRPSGNNPNFLQRIVKEVELPENAHFAPRLNIIVKDTRLGGFQTPIIGSASIEMTTKIPWSPHYKPPQSDGFAEIELEAAEVGEETPLMEGEGKDPYPETDNGAGVFGALKSMGVDFDPNDPSNFNDAASRQSTTTGEEDDTQRKYLKHRELLEGELENELKTTPFEKYALHIGQKQNKPSLMAMINPFSKKAPKTTGGIYKVGGYFKGLIRIMEREDERPLIDIDRLLKVHPYEIRVYVLDGMGFAPMDLGLNGRPGKSDPYLKLTLGKTKVDDRKNYVDDTTDPDFYKMFVLSANLPGASLLKIDAMDFDLIGGDDLIGSTTIDLEDRLFDQRWQDMGKMYETANRLRLKPLETRTLTIPTSKAPMGTIKMWVDILSPAQAHDYPPIDISLPPPVEFELRVIVWKARNVPSFDEAEDMNDLFFRVWMEGSEYQETDIHWRAKKGKGSFNWRMKFPVTLGHKQPNTKYPYFHIQGWDKDVFTANDAIGEHMMDLGAFFQKAYKLKGPLQFFEDDEETKKKKKKSTSDDDAAVRKIKEATGLWDDSDPPDSKWMKLEQVDHKTQQRKYMGEVCVSMELVPMEKAKQQGVGQGRNSPNHSPYLPPPAGRLSFSLNPFKVFNDLLGPSICNRIMCCLCCVAFMVIVYFLAPFINLAIVTLKK
jgi:hypothetical protein